MFKVKKVISILCMFACLTMLLSGCEKRESISDGKENKKESEHEPITINAPYRNITGFIDKVHEKYPEINIEVVPYSGQNTTGWMKAMLSSGNLTDIYFTTVYSPNFDDVKDKLLDISRYEFTDNYVQSRLREVTTDGAVYMLPLYYSCIGITYNKTLLEKNGWKLPNTLDEAEKLADEVREAGYNFCLDMTQYPGFGFQYLCNILDTDFLSTTDGIKWQEDYLNGKTNIESSPEMSESMNIIQRWKDIGFLTSMYSEDDDDITKEKMLSGNTLFLLGNSQDLSQEDGITDEYKLMPYISEDGTRNVFILNVNRYVGINKHLADKGNEQKLEDVLHIMEVLSTEEGMWALNPAQKGIMLLPLKDEVVDEDSYYSEAIDLLNNGYTAPFIYSGWENIIVTAGNTMLDYISGNAELEDIIRCIDDNQRVVTEDTPIKYTNVVETLDTVDCARLVGIGFAKAVNADAALISMNEYHSDEEEMNCYGVSGSLFEIPVTDQEIVSIIPTGWRNNIETVTLTGKEIKRLSETGFEKMGNGNAYPYELVTKEGTQLDDETLYTVVICGATDEVKARGNIKDTGVLGLDAMKDYLKEFDTISKKDIVWK